jgi:hypothetical protein
MTPEDRIKQLRSDATPTEAEWLEFRSTAHRSLARRRMAAVAGGLGLVVALVIGGYAVANMDTGDERGPGIAGTPTPTATGDPSPDPSASTETEEQEQVFVQQWFMEKGELRLFFTRLPRSEEPAADAITNLLTGLPEELVGTDVETAIPEGTSLREMDIQDGTATIALSGDYPDDSDVQQTFAYAQIVYTATQFDSVKDVVLEWESPTSGGVASGPEGRDRYHDLLPPIVVESPADGSEIGPSFTLSGIANVFEANVSWRVEDMEGNTLQEGFVTATCGSGCWGTFEDDIRLDDLPTKLPGDGLLLTVFQASAEDGSPMNVVTVPLNFVDTGTEKGNP